jgi:hypothetical protein
LFIALIIGIICGPVVATAASTQEPSACADATLQLTAFPPDEQVLRLLEPPEAAHLEIDLATLRGLGAHDRVDIWSATDPLGSSCPIAIHRSTDDVPGTSCVPAGTTTFVDAKWNGFPVGLPIHPPW